ncbi:MAG: hypothetical protein C5B49_10760 [Bdellovibrio sp.]|nr:MAG: hypothetical protein C5B49_10760 [Bdellovibrio sp.]
MIRISLIHFALVGTLLYSGSAWADYDSTSTWNDPCARARDKSVCLTIQTDLAYFDSQKKPNTLLDSAAESKLRLAFSVARKANPGKDELRDALRAYLNEKAATELSQKDKINALKTYFPLTDYRALAGNYQPKIHKVVRQEDIDAQEAAAKAEAARLALQEKAAKEAEAARKQAAAEVEIRRAALTKEIETRQADQVRAAKELQDLLKQRDALTPNKETHPGAAATANKGPEPKAQLPSEQGASAKNAPTAKLADAKPEVECPRSDRRHACHSLLALLKKLDQAPESSQKEIWQGNLRALLDTFRKPKVTPVDYQIADRQLHNLMENWKIDKLPRDVVKDLRHVQTNFEEADYQFDGTHRAKYFEAPFPQTASAGQPGKS